MAKLYIMCGPPACGKSTWISEHLDMTYDVWVSRDEIRSSYINDTNDYFAYEKQVYKDFVRIIQTNLDAGLTVYADATHLNQKSRANLLHALSTKNVEVNIIQFFVPLEVCLERNKARSGRRRVPKSVLRRMWCAQTDANFDDEIIKYNFVMTIEQEGGRIL